MAKLENGETVVECEQCETIFAISIDDFSVLLTAGRAILCLDCQERLEQKSADTGIAEEDIELGEDD